MGSSDIKIKSSPPFLTFGCNISTLVSLKSIEMCLMYFVYWLALCLFTFGWDSNYKANQRISVTMEWFTGKQRALCAFVLYFKINSIVTRIPLALVTNCETLTYQNVWNYWQINSKIRPQSVINVETIENEWIIFYYPKPFI